MFQYSRFLVQFDDLLMSKWLLAFRAEFIFDFLQAFHACSMSAARRTLPVLPFVVIGLADVASKSFI